MLNLNQSTTLQFMSVTIGQAQIDVGQNNNNNTIVIQ